MEIALIQFRQVLNALDVRFYPGFIGFWDTRQVVPFI